MKSIILCSLFFSVGLFASNNLSSEESQSITKKLNKQNPASWTENYYRVQFEYIFCPSNKSQCAFNFKMWPSSSEVEIREGSYNGRGKGFYWTASVLERGLVDAKCTLKSLTEYEDMVAGNGVLDSEVLSKLEDCLSKITNVSVR